MNHSYLNLTENFNTYRSNHKLEREMVCTFFAQTTQPGAMNGKVQTKNVEYFNIESSSLLAIELNLSAVLNSASGQIKF